MTSTESMWRWAVGLKVTRAARPLLEYIASQQVMGRVNIPRVELEAIVGETQVPTVLAELRSIGLRSWVPEAYPQNVSFWFYPSGAEPGRHLGNEPKEEK